MPKYANQKTIIFDDIEKIKHKKGSNEQSIQPIDFKYEKEAMKQLGGSAFILWRYLLSLTEKAEYYFSPAEITKETGLSESIIHRSLKKLLECEYIEEVKEQPSCYLLKYWQSK